MIYRVFCSSVRTPPFSQMTDLQGDWRCVGRQYNAKEVWMFQNILFFILHALHKPSRRYPEGR